MHNRTPHHSGGSDRKARPLTVGAFCLSLGMIIDVTKLTTVQYVIYTAAITQPFYTTTATLNDGVLTIEMELLPAYGGSGSRDKIVIDR